MQVAASGFRLAVRLAEHFAQAGKFVRCQVTLPLYFLVAFDLPARIDPIRPNAPRIGQGEHDRQDAQHPVGLIGRLFQPLVQFDDIGTGHVNNLERSQLRRDEQVHAAAIFILGRRLAVRGDVFVKEPLAECLHGRGGAQPVALRARIAAQPHIGEMLHGLGAGLIRGDRAMRADIDPTDAPTRAELGEVDFAARRMDPEPEAPKLVIPEEIFLASSGSGLDGTFRDLDHALASSAGITGIK